MESEECFPIGLEDDDVDETYNKIDSNLSIEEDDGVEYDDYSEGDDDF